MNIQPDQPTDANPFARIEQICREYRSQLKQGGMQRIEDYLQGFESSSRSMLFRNLLHIDIEYRRRRHDAPSSEEYAARFPQFKKIIREAFFESTMMSIDQERETPADAQTAIFEMPAARRLGDYELLDELGRGGFGVVYEARHIERGERVALKTLPAGIDGQTSTASEAERLHKFRREFRSLAEINHPNLVGMQTLEVEQGQWFFTMDLIVGQDFLSYVRPDNSIDESRLRAILPQLASGIMALHDQHVVHRDLKPSNILVGEDGHVTILDFGLVAELDQRTDHTMSLRSQHFVGTPRYAAPEQVYGKRDSASDWYALGTMVYEAITGKPPFEGAHAELFVRKQNEEAPKLSDRDDVPDDLARLVDQLLRKDPDSRPDASAIAQALSISRPAPRSESMDSKATGTWVPSESLLIGIESKLEELESALDRVEESNESQLVFVSGRSGEGKSSLVDKFLEPMKHRRRTIIFAGRCYDRESVPFKALDSIIDSLCNHLRARSEVEIANLLPDDIEFLAHLFPVLRRVDAIARRNNQHVATSDAEQIRHRGFRAMRELLVRLSENTAVVLFIDDLQWGDAESAGVLFQLLLRPTAPRLLFIGSYRSDEREQSPFLNEWHLVARGSDLEASTTTISLRPLSQQQCTELIERRVGYANESIRAHAERLFEETGGNPYFLDQLIECFDPSSTTTETTPVQQVIDKKLERLPSNARALLEVVSVAGQAISLREASEASGQRKPLFATVTHMRSERLVRLIGSEDQQLVDTYHDKIRETVLDGLGNSGRREKHSRLAEVIEKQVELSGADIIQLATQGDTDAKDASAVSARLFDLAYHYYESSSPRAFAYQLLAGQHALDAYAPEEAIHHLRKAEEFLPSYANQRAKYLLFERLGKACSILKQSEASIRYYESALKEAGDEFERARVETGIGVVHQQGGSFAAAAESFDRALLEVDERRPKGRVSCLISSFVSISQLVFVPGKWHRSRTEKGRLAAKCKCEILRRMVFVVNETSSIPQVQAGLRLAVMGLRSGEETDKAIAYCNAAANLAGLGLKWAGIHLLNRASRISERAQLDDEQTQLSFFSAWCDYRWAELSRAEKDFRKMRIICEKVGEHVYLVLTSHMLRHIFAITGSTSEELEMGLLEISLAKPANDRRGLCWGHFGSANALARSGDIKNALAHMSKSLSQLQSEAMDSSECIARATNSFVLLQSSRSSQAYIQAKRASELLHRTHQFQEFNVRCLPLLVESLIGPEWIKGPLESDRRVIRAAVRKCVFWTRMFPTLISHMHRAVGRAMASFGKSKKAIKRFEKAIRCAEAIGADYDRARALLDLSVLDQARQIELRNEAIVLLKKTESVIPYAERWQFGDQPDEDCFAKPIES